MLVKGPQQAKVSTNVLQDISYLVASKGFIRNNDSVLYRCLLRNTIDGSYIIIIIAVDANGMATVYTA